MKIAVLYFVLVIGLAWVGSGTFDVLLEFTPEPGPVPPGATAPQDTSGPSLEEALREQLGLKLESTKTAMDVLVLDHVEHPSGN